jgi:hypothetical protein
VRPERFELPAFWFVARRSIQLSYGRVSVRLILACASYSAAPPDSSLVSASGGLYPAEPRAHFVSWCVPTAYSRLSFPFNRDFWAFETNGENPRVLRPGLQRSCDRWQVVVARLFRGGGFLRGHPPSSNSRCPYFRSRRSAVNLVKRLPEVSGSEEVTASAVSFTFFIAPGGKGIRMSCPASK